MSEPLYIEVDAIIDHIEAVARDKGSAEAKATCWDIVQKLKGAGVIVRGSHD